MQLLLSSVFSLHMTSTAHLDRSCVGFLLQDPRVGYRLSCSSPAMHYSLGPQPAVSCKIWPPAATAKPPDHLAATAVVAAVDSSSQAAAYDDARSAAAVVKIGGEAGNVPAVASCGTCPAPWGLYTNLQGSAGSCCARRPLVHQRPMQSSSKPIATWTVLPTGVGAAPDQHADGEFACNSSQSPAVQQLQTSQHTPANVDST